MLSLQAPLLTLMSIPSPSDGVWNLGPVPIRGYALCIILGIVLAIWIGERRWVARGGTAGEVSDLAIWAVPFGLVGGRLYHVATDWELYFGEGRNPVTALYVWRGGLGIWGAIALGAVGVHARRRGDLGGWVERGAVELRRRLSPAATARRQQPEQRDRAERPTSAHAVRPPRGRRSGCAGHRDRQPRRPGGRAGSARTRSRRSRRRRSRPPRRPGPRC